MERIYGMEIMPLMEKISTVKLSQITSEKDFDSFFMNHMISSRSPYAGSLTEKYIRKLKEYTEKTGKDADKSLYDFICDEGDDFGITAAFIPAVIDRLNGTSGILTIRSYEEDTEDYENTGTVYYICIPLPPSNPLNLYEDVFREKVRKVYVSEEEIDNIISDSIEKIGIEGVECEIDFCEIEKDIFY